MLWILARVGWRGLSLVPNPEKGSGASLDRKLSLRITPNLTLVGSYPTASCGARVGKEGPGVGKILAPQRCLPPPPPGRNLLGDTPPPVWCTRLFSERAMGSVPTARIVEL